MLITLLMTCPGNGAAARYYKWTDAAGLVHFTDNALKVPDKYRKKAGNVINNTGPAAASEGRKAQVPTGRFINGEKLWKEKCSKCHHPGFGRKNKLRGLGNIAVNPETRYPAKMEQILPKLKYAVEGNTSIMDPIDLKEEELRAIAKYLQNAR